MQTFITASGACLPDAPVGNDRMIDFIGQVSPEAERRGKLTLRRNRIKTRHYAINPDGSSDWTVARLAADAARGAMAAAGLDDRAISLLATSTTQNDMMVPGLASGVHHELRLPPLEIASSQSVCASSMMAMKNAAMQVHCGEHTAALALGAEFSSRYFRPGFYTGTDAISPDQTLPDDAEFLRWTLSDGAGAVILENAPRKDGLSLQIEWITLRSFADRFTPCMTGGAVRHDDGSLTPWSHHASIHEAAHAGAFQLRQDVRELYRMLPVWLGELMRLVDEGRVETDKVDWFLCHYSAHSLREEMIKLATKAGCMIPEERWFTNLYEKGNVGSASIYLLIDDLLRHPDLKPGQRVLCAVPESGQCLMSYALMTVVEA